jgi:hypothetical protein
MTTGSGASVAAATAQQGGERGRETGARAPRSEVRQAPRRAPCTRRRSQRPRAPGWQPRRTWRRLGPLAAAAGGGRGACARIAVAADQLGQRGLELVVVHPSWAVRVVLRRRRQLHGARARRGSAGGRGWSVRAGPHTRSGVCHQSTRLDASSASGCSGASPLPPPPPSPAHVSATTRVVGTARRRRSARQPRVVASVTVGTASRGRGRGARTPALTHELGVVHSRKMRGRDAGEMLLQQLCWPLFCFF